MTPETDNRTHLAWALKSRARNQITALKLLVLFDQYEKYWKTKKLSRAAQDLSAIAFSLWRAAFLAEKTSKRGEVFAHAKIFLEKLIEDNMISYPQDKTSREWTFNYYTRNARHSLQNLATFWPEVSPPYVGKKRNATDRWDYCQDLFEASVDKFSEFVKEKARIVEDGKARQVSRDQRDENRRTVRRMTLAARAKK